MRARALPATKIRNISETYHHRPPIKKNERCPTSIFFENSREFSKVLDNFQKNLLNLRDDLQMAYALMIISDDRIDKSVEKENINQFINLKINRMERDSNPLSRVIKIAVVSGLLSGVVVLLLMWYVFASAWFFFIIPGVMGWAIRKYSHITYAEVQANENLEKTVGNLCGFIMLFYVIIFFGILFGITYLSGGSIDGLLLNPLFVVVAVCSVICGRKWGANAVIDSYTDSELN